MMALEIEKYGFVINGLRHVSGKESMEILEKEGYMLDLRPDFENGTGFRSHWIGAVVSQDHVCASSGAEKPRIKCNETDDKHQ